MDLPRSPVLVNGEICSTVEALDRGLAYGDGVFETIRLVQGQPVLWQQHWERLQIGLECLRITVSSDFKSRLQDDIRQLTALAGKAVDQAILKIVVTRGVGGRGYRPAPTDCTRILSLHALPSDLGQLQEHGMRVKILEYRLPSNPRLAKIKHLNRLDQVMASLELQQEDEGLLRDMDGFFIEGTKCNLLIKKGNRLLTPDLSRCGIAGVLRRYLMENAYRLGFKMFEEQITIETLKSADGLALMNSVIGLCPIRSLDDVELQIPESLRQLQSTLHSELKL